ncbi:MAG: hypothetical protein HY908_17370 [Myxococcales bacterium]|nr:hypothetical protein [Myxococcales bacterium]
MPGAPVPQARRRSPLRRRRLFGAAAGLGLRILTVVAVWAFGQGCNEGCPDQEDIFLRVIVVAYGGTSLSVRGGCAAMDVTLPPPGDYPYGLDVPITGRAGDSCVVTFTYPDGTTLVHEVALVWYAGCDFVRPEHSVTV